MKRLFTCFILLLSNCLWAQSSNRDALLGTYSGTYLNYSNGNLLPSGSKFTPLASDETGLIINDTVNNIIDTMYLCSGEFLCNIMTGPCGYFTPAMDSVYYSRCNGENGNPTAEFKLKNITHSAPTNIKEVTEPYFNLYPNPASDFVTIKSTQSIYTYNIYNTMGKLIVSGNQPHICISNLASGLYLLQIQTKYFNTTKLFIKD